MGGQFDAGNTRRPYLYSEFDPLFKLLDVCPDIISRYSYNNRSSPNLKKEKGLMEYQHKEPSVPRPTNNDRVFPLETVELQSYRTKYHSDIDKVTIHTGPYADEYARSFNALAITIAAGIFFRDNAYNPATETGRAILVHELTHIDQYQSGRITENEPREILEKEAELAEQGEVYNPDPLMTIRINGKLFSFPRTKMRKYAEDIASAVNEWVQGRQYTLDERGYLSLLCNYKTWLERRI
jgi:hypothetical protein